MEQISNERNNQHESGINPEEHSMIEDGILMAQKEYLRH